MSPAALVLAALLQVVSLAPPPPAPAPLPDSSAPPPSDDLCDEPVLLMISAAGSEAASMRAYAEAVSRSAAAIPYGGYALNAAGALEALAGDDLHPTLIMRFPCVANAQAYWASEAHQRAMQAAQPALTSGTIRATIHREAPLPEALVGQVGDNGYRASFDASVVPQHAPR